MTEQFTFSGDKARAIGEAIGIDWATGKIALAHLNEFPDYYTRLAEMEADAERYWEQRDQDRAG